MQIRTTKTKSDNILNQGNRVDPTHRQSTHSHIHQFPSFLTKRRTSYRHRESKQNKLNPPRPRQEQNGKFKQLSRSSPSCQMYSSFCKMREPNRGHWGNIHESPSSLRIYALMGHTMQINPRNKCSTPSMILSLSTP